VNLVIKFLCLRTGDATQHDGRYLLEYDPTIRWTDEGGQHCLHLVSTSSKSKAKRFPDLAAVQRCWARSIGTRPDGKPDRPLTAYSVEIERVP
jgi:hypothetical protein